MNERIEFQWKGKIYTGSFSKKNELWWITLDNGNSYLLAKDDRGWFCPSLKRPLAEIIGAQLERKAEYSSTDN